MTLPVDITDGRGLSNEVHCELQPKKSKVTLYLPFISQYKAFNQLYITNKMECFSFKSRHYTAPDFYVDGKKTSTCYIDFKNGLAK